MSLFREIMYANAPVLKISQEFFGESARFNDLEAPHAGEIAEFQMRKLSEFQKLAFKDNPKTERINTFLNLNGRLATSTNEYDQIIYASLNKLFNEVNQLISSGYMSKHVRTELATNKTLEANVEQKLRLLGSTLNQLRSQANMTISSFYIDRLDSIILSLPSGDIDAVLRTLFHLKGDILEEVGVEWFNQRIPRELNVKAVSTGAIYGKKGQLISDLIVIDMDRVDLLNKMIHFKMGDQSYNMTLQQFFTMMESKKGSETISIDSSGELLLQEISLLGVQAKAGINQLPWNSGSRNTWASIQGDDGVLDNYLDFLDHVNNLKRTWDVDNKNIKKESQAYKMMADYELARSIQKVLHLSQSANQYVLTPNGFVPFVSRIIELYEKNSGRYYFSFKGKIQMDGAEDLLTRTRPVIMPQN